MRFESARNYDWGELLVPRARNTLGINSGNLFPMRFESARNYDWGELLVPRARNMVYCIA
ncbi:hypothetical protein L195_g059875, partial [Trifolium pratense]